MIAAMKPRRWHNQRPHRPREAESAGPAIVYGVEPVREMAAAAPGLVSLLYVRAGLEERFAPEMASVRSAGGRVAISDEAELARVVGRDARHQGIAAAVRDYTYAPFEEILETRPDPLVLADGVTDPRNLGALMRSAEGAGVRAIVIARDRTAGVTPAAVKASAGAWVHLKIAQCGNVARALEDLKEAGYWIAALAPGGDVSIYQLDVSRRLVIVVGAEGRGVREIVRKRSDMTVSIPMRGRVESLNVSVAVAVALFEIMRRRG